MPHLGQYSNVSSSGLIATAAAAAESAPAAGKLQYRGIQRRNFAPGDPAAQLRVQFTHGAAAAHGSPVAPGPSAGPAEKTETGRYRIQRSQDGRTDRRPDRPASGQREAYPGGCVIPIIKNMQSPVFLPDYQKIGGNGKRLLPDAAGAGAFAHPQSRSEYLDAVQLALDNLPATYRNRDQQAIQKAAELIFQSNRVFLVGNQISAAFPGLHLLPALQIQDGPAGHQFAYHGRRR